MERKNKKYTHAHARARTSFHTLFISKLSKREGLSFGLDN